MPATPNSFHHLPALPKSLFVDYLNLSDALKFSTCSRKCAEIVKTVSIEPRCLKWQLDTNNDEQISLEGPGRQRVLFRVVPRKAEEIPQRHVFGEMNSVPVCICDTVTPFSTWYFDGCGAEKLSEHLLNVLSPKAFLVDIRTNFPMRSFVWRFTRKVESLRVHGVGNPVILSPEDVKFVLEDVESESLDMMNVTVSEQLRYSKGLKSRRVALYNPTWLHKNAIFDSETVWFDFHDYMPTAALLNDLLKQWIGGRMDRLEHIGFRCMTHDRSQSPFFLDEVFRDIQFTDWDPKVTRKIVEIDGGRQVFQRGHEVLRCDGEKRAIVIANAEGYFPFSMYAFANDKLIREEQIEAN